MWKIMKIVKEDLLKGTAPYIRDHQLYFDSFKVSEKEVKLFNKHKLLVEYELPRKILFNKGETLTFILTEGKMKMKIT